MLAKVLFILVVAGTYKGEEPGKLSLTVLYESRCPDSRTFVRQLLPAMKLLHDRVKLELVPFGKAYSVDGAYGRFECQHGPSECQGNIVQDCTLNLMSNRDDLDKTEYVTCEMDTFAAATGSLMVFNQMIQDMSQVDLIGTLCAVLGRRGDNIGSQYYNNYVPTNALG